MQLQFLSNSEPNSHINTANLADVRPTQETSISHEYEWTFFLTVEVKIVKLVKTKFGCIDEDNRVFSKHVSFQ